MLIATVEREKLKIVSTNPLDPQFEAFVSSLGNEEGLFKSVFKCAQTGTGQEQNRSKIRQIAGAGEFTFENELNSKFRSDFQNFHDDTPPLKE